MGVVVGPTDEVAELDDETGGLTTAPDCIAANDGLVPKPIGVEDFARVMGPATEEDFFDLGI